MCGADLQFKVTFPIAEIPFTGKMKVPCRQKQPENDIVGLPEYILLFSVACEILSCEYKNFCVRMCISLEESLEATLTVVVSAPHMRDGFTSRTCTLFKNDLPIAY